MNYTNTENSMVRGAQAQYDREEDEALAYERRLGELSLNFVEAVKNADPKRLAWALPDVQVGALIDSYLRTDEGAELFGRMLQEAAAGNREGAGALVQEIILACANQYAETFARSTKRPAFGALNLPSASSLTIRRPAVGAVKLEPARAEVTAGHYALMDSMGSEVAA